MAEWAVVLVPFIRSCLDTNMFNSILIRVKITIFYNCVLDIRSNIMILSAVIFFVKAAKRLMAILPFKEVKSALTEWLDANIDDKSDLNLIKHYLSNPEALAKVAKAMAKNEAQMEAKKNKIKSAKELIEQGDRKQREFGKDVTELEISPISEKGKQKREQNLDRQLADSMDNFISVARGLSFSSRPSNKEESVFLEQEYDGHCQICLKQIRKYNGEHYFEAINIIKFSKLPERLANSGKYGWNSLCLCPNCAAEYNYCSTNTSNWCRRT